MLLQITQPAAPDNGDLLVNKRLILMYFLDQTIFEELFEAKLLNFIRLNRSSIGLTQATPGLASTLVTLTQPAG